MGEKNNETREVKEISFRKKKKSMRARSKAMLETESTPTGKIIQDSLSNASLKRKLSDPRFKILKISVQSVSFHFVALHGPKGREC